MEDFIILTVCLLIFDGKMVQLHGTICDCVRWWRW